MSPCNKVESPGSQFISNLLSGKPSPLILSQPISTNPGNLIPWSLCKSSRESPSSYFLCSDFTLLFSRTSRCYIQRDCHTSLNFTCVNVGCKYLAVYLFLSTYAVVPCLVNFLPYYFHFCVVLRYYLTHTILQFVF